MFEWNILTKLCIIALGLCVRESVWTPIRPIFVSISFLVQLYMIRFYSQKSRPYFQIVLAIKKYTNINALPIYR